MGQTPLVDCSSERALIDVRFSDGNQCKDMYHVFFDQFVCVLLCYE